MKTSSALRKAEGEENVTFESYRIEDYLQGLSVNRIFGSEKEKIVGPEAAIPHFLQQLAILRAVIARFESSRANCEAVLALGGFFPGGLTPLRHTLGVKVFENLG